MSGRLIYVAIDPRGLWKAEKIPIPSDTLPICHVGLDLKDDYVYELVSSGLSSIVKKTPWVEFIKGHRWYIVRKFPEKHLRDLATIQTEAQKAVGNHVPYSLRDSRNTAGRCCETFAIDLLCGPARTAVSDQTQGRFHDDGSTWTVFNQETKTSWPICPSFSSKPAMVLALLAGIGIFYIDRSTIGAILAIATVTEMWKTINTGEPSEFLDLLVKVALNQPKADKP
jgi:hypothetical protein